LVSETEGTPFPFHEKHQLSFFPLQTFAEKPLAAPVTIIGNVFSVQGRAVSWVRQVNHPPLAAALRSFVSGGDFICVISTLDLNLVLSSFCANFK